MQVSIPGKFAEKRDLTASISLQIAMARSDFCNGSSDHSRPPVKPRQIISSRSLFFASLRMADVPFSSNCLDSRVVPWNSVSAQRARVLEDKCREVDTRCALGYP